MGTLALSADLIFGAYLLVILLLFLAFLRICKKYKVGSTYSQGARTASIVIFLLVMGSLLAAGSMGFFVSFVPIAALAFAIFTYFIAASSGISYGPLTRSKHFVPIAVGLTLLICAWAAYKAYENGRGLYYDYVAETSRDPRRLEEVFSLFYGGPRTKQEIWVMEAVAQNSHTPPSVLMKLAQYPDPEVQAKLAQNRRLPSEVLDQLIRSTNDYRALVYSARDRRLNHEQLWILASKDFKYPNGSPDELGEWLYDQYVYPQLIDHPAESQDVLNLLAKRVRSDKSVRHFLKSPKATCKEWETLQSRQSAMPKVRSETWLSLAEKMVHECRPTAYSSKTQ